MSEKVKNFEESIARLEEIARALENQATPLDESLSLYEEGVGLIKSCSKLLDEATEKVTVLGRNTETGEVEEKPFAGSEKMA